MLNGIDTATWNPATDPHIARPYGLLTLERKLASKRALKKRMKLAGSDDIPLLATVSRITHQKGIDVIASTLADLTKLAQVVVVGAGDREMIEQLKAALAQSHPRAASATMGFDETLAHLIEAGADAFLMPSRFEPCGMNQMYSQRYGTPPIVRATGGLADTVVDCTACYARRRQRQRIRVSRAQRRGAARSGRARGRRLARRRDLARAAAKRHGAGFRLERERAPLCRDLRRAGSGR